MAVRRNGFRPIHYLGNKSRMLEQIASAMRAMNPTGSGAACDLFTGTGVVARRLAEDQPVLAADVQEYARLLAAAQGAPNNFTANDRQALVAQARDRAEELSGSEFGELAGYEDQALARGDLARLAAVVENGSVEAWSRSPDASLQRPSPFAELVRRAAQATDQPPALTLSRYYGGVYFGYGQAIELDAIGDVVRRLAGTERDTATAALLSTASELVASVGGHFAQPLRVTTRSGELKTTTLHALVRKRRLSVLESYARWLDRWSALKQVEHQVHAVRSDFREVVDSLPSGVSAVYADPPYTRDHYSRFYHVLETIARGDDPGLSTMKLGGRSLPSRGLYRSERHQSPFSVVSEAPGALAYLAEALARREVSLLFSYSPIPDTDKPRDRVMTLRTVMDVLSASYSQVETLVVEGLGHSRLNAAHLSTPMTRNAEVLLACRTR